MLAIENSFDIYLNDMRAFRKDDPKRYQAEFKSYSALVKQKLTKVYQEEALKEQEAKMVERAKLQEIKKKNTGRIHLKKTYLTKKEDKVVIEKPDQDKEDEIKYFT